MAVEVKPVARRRRAFVSAVVVLIAATIGDASAAETSPATDAKRARSVLLRPRDLPRGWKSTAPPPLTAEDERVAHRMSECVGGAPESHTVATARGRSFRRGNASASSSAGVVASAADYRKEVRAAMGPNVEPCLRDVLSDRYTGAGLLVRSTRFERLRVNRHGSFTRAVRIVFTLSTGDGEADLYLDAVFFGKRRVEASLQFTNVGRPFDPLLEAELVSRVGRRIDKV